MLFCLTMIQNDGTAYAVAVGVVCIGQFRLCGDKQRCHAQAGSNNQSFHIIRYSGLIINYAPNILIKQNIATKNKNILRLFNNKVGDVTTQQS